MNPTTTEPVSQPLLEEYYINEALRILEHRLRTPGIALGAADNVKKYLTLRLAELPYEAFGALFLDMRNKLIVDVLLFRGTLGHVNVYPREVVKEALKYNANNVVIYHNHPSGESTPSLADHELTRKLQEALSIVNCAIVDHVIVAGTHTYSFSDHGEI